MAETKTSKKVIKFIRIDEVESRKKRGWVESTAYTRGPLPKESILLGRGILTWNARERRSDRYGYVYLVDSEEDEAKPVPMKVYEEQHGSLVARVEETRVSEHVGDLVHEVYPRTPIVGMNITLGTGMLSYMTDQSTVPTAIVVGLKPDDDRSDQWLNIRALYDTHYQTVELYFIPTRVV